MLSSAIEDVRAQHLEKPISPEAYQRWKASGVTRRLMEELEVELVQMLTADIYTADTTDQIGQLAIVKQATREAVENVITWKPVELVKEDD